MIVFSIWKCPAEYFTLEFYCDNVILTVHEVREEKIKEEEETQTEKINACFRTKQVRSEDNANSATDMADENAFLRTLAAKKQWKVTLGGLTSQSFK